MLWLWLSLLSALIFSVLPLFMRVFAALGGILILKERTQLTKKIIAGFLVFIGVLLLR